MSVQPLDKQTEDAIDTDRPLDVEHIEGDLYSMESSNNMYYVDITKEKPCDCMGQHFHGHCRHERRLKILLGLYPLPRHLENSYTDLDKDDYPTENVRYE